MDERQYSYEESIAVAIDVQASAWARAAQEAEYLCRECARSLGGVWPDGHRVTSHLATCPFCHSYRPLVYWGDWNWPAMKTREV